MTVVPICSDLAWLGIRAWTGPFRHSANSRRGSLFRIILVTQSGSEGVSQLSCGLRYLHLFHSLLTCHFSRQEVGPVHPYLQPPLIWTVLDDLLEWNGWSGILEASYKVLAGPILVFWEKPGHVRIPPPSFRCSHMLTDTLDMWLSNSSHHLMAIMYKIPSTTYLTEPSQPTWL